MIKVLLPTDFSENSWNAISYALQLFKTENCTFYLLNTYTPIIYQIEYAHADPAHFDAIKSMRDHAETKLKELKNRINTNYNFSNHNIESIASFNTLTEEINSIVEEKNINYIVMGTKGATGAEEILFGSNTVHVYKNAKCPVLAIPTGYAFDKPYDVLFPTDFEIPYESHHISPIITILSMYTTRLNILNMTFGYELSEKQKSNKLSLDEALKAFHPAFHLISNQTVTEGITKFLQKNKINFLIMINNKHSFFENLFFKSKVNQIGFHLKVPFLVIPSIID